MKDKYRKNTDGIASDFTHNNNNNSNNNNDINNNNDNNDFSKKDPKPISIKNIILIVFIIISISSIFINIFQFNSIQEFKSQIPSDTTIIEPIIIKSYFEEVNQNLETNKIKLDTLTSKLDIYNKQIIKLVERINNNDTLK